MHKGFISWLLCLLDWVVIVVSGVGSARAAEPIRLPDDVLQAFLDSGKWSPDAPSKTGEERLNKALATRLIIEYRAAPTDPQKIGQLGLLVLATSVAEWGVSPDPGIPDPASPPRRLWAGVPWNLGKHLMSYEVGGVGIIHADVEILAEFIRMLSNTDLSSDPGKQHILGLAGQKYAVMKDDRVFVFWMNTGLHDRNAQRWLIEYFINNQWIQSYDAVRKARGKMDNQELKEVFVNARIRNTAAGLANCIIGKSQSDEDELALYAALRAGCNGNPNEKRRLGEMRRPRVLFDALH
jgi:hypothetical protein